LLKARRSNLQPPVHNNNIHFSQLFSHAYFPVAHPNFAAALVIQGSACVYSKKVEYLHSLVYQALEFVADRKVKSLKNKGKADAGNQDDDEFDDEEHFLSLDDTLEGNKMLLYKQ
jgi:hypothetical protein